MKKINQENFCLQEKLQLVGRVYGTDRSKKAKKADIFIRNTCNRKHMLYEPSVINKGKIILKKAPVVDEKNVVDPGVSKVTTMRVEKTRSYVNQKHQSAKFWRLEHHHAENQ